MRRFVAILGCSVWFGLTAMVRAGEESHAPQVAPKTPEELRLEAANAEFTKKQEAANWYEKFDRIGNEMGVPPDILAAVSFAETRWFHLTWPPGETVSPENGMPHAYGIMSLMDNDYFGHGLIEAAKLIGKTPEELKADPELNIRGGAALLKKLYDENPLPDGTTTNDIESWQNAIMKYTGIPEDYLSYDHVYSCYVYMTQGYDQYGMHWKPHPVNLEPMRERRDRYMQAQNELIKSREGLVTEQLAATQAPAAAPLLIQPPAPKVTVTNIVPPTQITPGFSWIMWALMALAILLVTGLLLRSKKENQTQPNPP